jgi:AcrR family transcriptional regulator
MHASDMIYMKESRREALALFHRTNIIRAAEQLFLKKGIENTTMDNIAREADYSKATLYVYFENKEEIISSITLISMKLFLNVIRRALSEEADFFGQYYALCDSMSGFHNEHPLYYNCLLREINIDLEAPETPRVYQEIFDAGEEINKVIGDMLAKGMEQGHVRSEINPAETVFIFWAGISGLINMAVRKEKYLSRYIGVTREEFIRYGFETLLQSILVK